MNLLTYLVQGFLMIYELTPGLHSLSAPQHMVVYAPPHNWTHPICLFTAAGS